MALKTVKPKLKTLDIRRIKTLVIPSNKPKVEMLTNEGRDGVNGRIRGRKGMAIRERWLALHPLCVVCKEEGHVKAGQEVDHIQPLWAEGLDDDDNKQTLCKEHHKAKSKVEWSMRWRGPGAVSKSGG